MRTAEINYYDVLGVNQNATTADIKRRYRSLSKQYHPDTPGGDEQKMAQINVAYEVLSDPLKRHHYSPPPNNNHTPPSTDHYQRSPKQSTYNQPRPVSAPKKHNAEPAYGESLLKSFLQWVAGLGFAAVAILVLLEPMASLASGLLDYDSKLTSNTTAAQGAEPDVDSGTSGVRPVLSTPDSKAGDIANNAYDNLEDSTPAEDQLSIPSDESATADSNGGGQSDPVVTDDELGSEPAADDQTLDESITIHRQQWR